MVQFEAPKILMRTGDCIVLHNNICCNATVAEDVNGHNAIIDRNVSDDDDATDPKAILSSVSSDIRTKGDMTNVKLQISHGR